MAFEYNIYNNEVLEKAIIKELKTSDLNNTIVAGIYNVKELYYPTYTYQYNQMITEIDGFQSDLILNSVAIFYSIKKLALDRAYYKTVGFINTDDYSENFNDLTYIYPMILVLDYSQMKKDGIVYYEVPGKTNHKYIDLPLTLGYIKDIKFLPNYTAYLRACNVHNINY
jgi:hypothetical protein